MKAGLVAAGVALLALGCGSSRASVDGGGGGSGGGAAGGSGGAATDAGGGGSDGRDGGGGAAGADAGGGGDASAATYAGCRFIGGIDRIVVGKRDVARNLCFTLVLALGNAPHPGLTLPSGWSVESAGAETLTPSCPTRVPAPVPATASGSVDWTPGPTSPPDAVNVDVVLTFPANDAGAPTSEPLTAIALDVTPGC